MTRRPFARWFPSTFNLFDRLLAFRSQQTRVSKARLGFEPLEDRVVLAIDGYVWFDLNDNGTWDSGELPAEGVAIHVTDDTNTQAGIDTTDAYGYYSISPTGPADYTVSLNSHWEYAQNAQGAVTLSSGSLDFALVGHGDMEGGTLSISGFVWRDSNVNSKFDGGESEADTVTVDLYVQALSTSLTPVSTSGAGCTSLRISGLGTIPSPSRIRTEMALPRADMGR